MTIQLGGCDGKQVNCIPSRRLELSRALYRPRKEILEGKWKFPEATPVQ